MLQFQAISLQLATVRLFARSIVTHISPTLSLLRADSSDNEVYLLGTAHVSNASSQEVVDLIRLVNPKTVFLELDASRAAQLRRHRDTSDNNGQKEFSSFDLMKYMQGNPLFDSFLKNYANSTSSPSVEKILPAIPSFLQKLGWLPPPGGEMIAAMKEANRIGARCHYGDVELNDTTNGLKAVAFNMMSPDKMMQMIARIPAPPPELAELFEGLIKGGNPEQLIEDIKTRERSKMMTSYLSRCFPAIYDVMITRRDVHMAKQLKEYCSKGKVVAVVGIAHVIGIEREWEHLNREVKRIA